MEKNEEVPELEIYFPWYSSMYPKKKQQTAMLNFRPID